MGQHLVPQFYLRGFAPPGQTRVWTYRKGGDSPELLPIKSIEQRKGQYGQVEKRLAEEIETPANTVLQKIKWREPISATDKMVFSKYVYVLAKRVDASNTRFVEYAPKVASQEIERWARALREHAERKFCDAALCDEKMKEIERIMGDLAANPTKEVWAEAILLELETIPGLLSRMTWTFYTCPSPEFFITCDNPVFFHFGIGWPSSDLSCPVSKEVTVLATWQKHRDLQFREASPQQIRELNRRAAFNATRSVYSPTNKDWISDLINKRKPEVHRWTVAFPYRASRQIQI